MSLSAASLPRSSGTHGKDPVVMSGEQLSLPKNIPFVVSAVKLIANPAEKIRLIRYDVEESRKFLKRIRVNERMFLFL